MRAYRHSTNLKLGLVLLAVAIAVASLAYTNRVVKQLREREQAVIQIWANTLAQVPALQQQSQNPYLPELRALERLLQQSGEALPLPADSLGLLRRAVQWAQDMPPTPEFNVVLSAIQIPSDFGIPVLVRDSLSGRPQMWLNLPIDSTGQAGLTPADSARLQAIRADMDATYAPIPIVLAEGGIQQFVHYGESNMVKELRLFPYIQFVIVALFILVGYVGFSYVRRSEQRSLWVGMAKEAAHQLGTPISSLMGWQELLQLRALTSEQEDEAYAEIGNDITRLQRVANRFSDIGSLPKLEVMPVAEVVESTARYIRRRIPQQGKQVALSVEVPERLRAPLNAELFEWVIENLLKNALDAIETPQGEIQVKAWQEEEQVLINVVDTGKGIERRQWKNVFRPGYSTKKRGWGLGLSLAKRIVEDYHGGSLTVLHSKPGQGTTFRVVLPAA